MIEHDGEIKIVVLQRGWVLVGIFERQFDGKCSLRKARVIRRWGTSRGLGELSNGPLDETILEPCHGLVEFDNLTMVLSLSVNQTAWARVLNANN